MLYELRNLSDDETRSLPSNFASEAVNLVNASQCLVKTSECGTKLIELQFKSEEAFHQVLLKNDWLQEKLNGTLVELKTADMYSDAATIGGGKIKSVDEKHNISDLLKKPATKQINQSSQNKNKSGFNLSIIKEEEDH